MIQHFSIREELAAKGNDYLLVLSTPPTYLEPGQTLTYPIKVLSKQTQLTYQLESGPKGMSVSAQGVVTWHIPADFAEKDAVAVVHIRGASGTETTHTIKLAEAERVTERVVKGRPTRPKRDKRLEVAPAEEALRQNDPAALGSKLEAKAVALRPSDTVSLPSTASRFIVGGSGKYLVAQMPQVKQLAVVAIAARKIVATIDIEDPNVLVAVGETRLVVHQRRKGTLSRYKLSTGERELSVSSQPYENLALGSSSEGPLLGRRAQLELLDFETLQVNGSLEKLQQMATNGPLLAAANGKFFGYSNEGLNPSGMLVLHATGKKLSVSYAHLTAGHVLPGPDGRIIYTELGRYDANCNPLDGPKHGPAPRILLPAATGPFYLTLTINNVAGVRKALPAELTVHLQNDSAALFTAEDVLLPDLPGQIRPAHLAQANLEERLFFLPDVDALVTIPLRMNHLVVQQFNVCEELDKRHPDYLYVVSVPPTHLQARRKTFVSTASSLQERESEIQPGERAGEHGGLGGRTGYLGCPRRFTR